VPLIAVPPIVYGKVNAIVSESSGLVKVTMAESHASVIALLPVAEAIATFTPFEANELAYKKTAESND